MDVEKTIQFLTENAPQHDARIAAIESNMLTLTTVVKGLADNMRELDAQSRQRDAELDAKSRERDAALDERISKLVSAIAALVSGRSNPQQPLQ